MAPTKKVNKTPYEIWHGVKPKVSFLRVWGCNAYVTSESSDKLDPRGDKVIFVGYPKKIGYYLYNPKENQFFLKPRGEFLEEEFLAHEIGDSVVDLDEIQANSVTNPRDETAVQSRVIVEESERFQETADTQDNSQKF